MNQYSYLNVDKAYLVTKDRMAGVLLSILILYTYYIMKDKIIETLLIF